MDIVMPPTQPMVVGTSCVLGTMPWRGTRNVEHARIGIHWTWYFIRCIHFQTRYASYQGISYSTQNTQICCDIHPNKMLKQIVNKYPKPKTSTTSVCCKRTVVMFLFNKQLNKPSPTFSPFIRTIGIEVWNWNRDPKKRMKSFPIFR